MGERLFEPAAPIARETHATLDPRASCVTPPSLRLRSSALPQPHGAVIVAEPLPGLGQVVDERLRVDVCSLKFERGAEIVGGGAIRVARQRVPPCRGQIQRGLPAGGVGLRAREMESEHVCMSKRVLADRSLDGPRDVRVEQSCPRDAEGIVDDVLDDRMGEVVVALVGAQRFHQDSSATQLVQRGQHGLFRQLAHRREGVEPEARADDGGDAGNRSRVRAEMLQTLADRGLHRAWQVQLLDLPPEPGSAALVQASRVDQRLQRLLDEKRMAARPRVQPARQLPRRWVIDRKCLGYKLLDFRLSERLQPQQLRRAQSQQRLLHVPQSRIPIELAFAVRPDNRDAGSVYLSGHEVQQLQ